MRCTQSGWAIIAYLPRTEIRAAATSVATFLHIEEVPGDMTIEKASVDATGIAGEGKDAGDHRRGDAGASKDQKAALTKGVVDRDAGVGVGHG